jgi:hypothetical protein
VHRLEVIHAQKEGYSSFFIFDEKTLSFSEFLHVIDLIQVMLFKGYLSNVVGLYSIPFQISLSNFLSLADNFLHIFHLLPKLLKFYLDLFFRFAY